MTTKRNTHLFKERITLSDYDKLADELCTAIDEGEEALKVLLLGTAEPELYADKGNFQDGQHDRCNGLALAKRNFTEKRICKCLYYFNSGHAKKCGKCSFPNRYRISGTYTIADYEVPACYYGSGIGEIDLVIAGDEVLYATEVKPPKDEFDPQDPCNQESILRMISEIMTYTLGYEPGKYKKAIAFFEDTKQAEEYAHMTPAVKKLIEKADITVFRFEKAGPKEYKICKL